MIYHYEPLQNRSSYYSKNDYKKSITCIAINSLKGKILLYELIKKNYEEIQKIEINKTYIAKSNNKITIYMRNLSGFFSIKKNSSFEQAHLFALTLMRRMIILHVLASYMHISIVVTSCPVVDLCFKILFYLA